MFSVVKTDIIVQAISLPPWISWSHSANAVFLAVLGKIGLLPQDTQKYLTLTFKIYVNV